MNADKADDGNGNGKATGNMLRADLPALPLEMRRLPIDSRGYPVPWFVHYSRGIPDFRVVEVTKFERAIRGKLCWICGQPMADDGFFCFISGPMAAVNRVSPEPPSHTSCALYSAQACPFLTTPERARNPRRMPRGAHLAEGTMRRNPGVAVLWTTRSYKTFKQGGDTLFEMGDPIGVQWMCQGRPATRDEAMEALRTGMPELEQIAKDAGSSRAELRILRHQYYDALLLLPGE